MADHHRFGAQSERRLQLLHPDVVIVLRRALILSPYDFTIIHTWRGEELQNALFESGASKARWPHSDHNTVDEAGNPLSDAVDFGPWISGAVPWDETHIFAAVAGVIMAVAAEHQMPFEWGGDWDGDGSTKDQTLLDWGHIARQT